jgi:hypothetical protein
VATRTREERLRIANEILARLREERERAARADAERQPEQLELPLGDQPLRPVTQGRQ